MKKTLLVSAFSAIAMVAGAQTEVASAVGEFDFITKNFTVGQKAIPYSLVKDEQNGKYENYLLQHCFQQRENHSGSS